MRKYDDDLTELYRVKATTTFIVHEKLVSLLISKRVDNCSRPTVKDTAKKF
jgi:hypothetical protein